jgi:hypothetical protein
VGGKLRGAGSSGRAHRRSTTAPSHRLTAAASRSARLPAPASSRTLHRALPPPASASGRPAPGPCPHCLAPGPSPAQRLLGPPLPVLAWALRQPRERLRAPRPRAPEAVRAWAHSPVRCHSAGRRCLSRSPPARLCALAHALSRRLPHTLVPALPQLTRAYRAAAPPTRAPGPAPPRAPVRARLRRARVGPPARTAPCAARSGHCCLC